MIDEQICEEIKQIAAIHKTGYINLLRLNSIVYDDDIKEKLETGEYDSFVLDERCIELLDVMADVNDKERYLDPKAKTNTIEILEYIKEKSQNKEQAESVIRVLKGSSTDKCYTFYRDQYLLRSGMFNEKTKSEFDPSIFKDDMVLKELRYSLSRDYQIVVALVDGPIEDSENILLSEFFINTINNLKYECPALLQIPSIKEEVRNILQKIRKEDLSNIDTLGKYRAKVLLKKLKKIGKQKKLT